MSRPEVTMLRAHGNPPESIFTGWLGPPNCSDGPQATERTIFVPENPQRPTRGEDARRAGERGVE